jgi:hypothetical protein
MRHSLSGQIINWAGWFLRTGGVRCDEGDAVIAALNQPTPDADRQQLIQELVCGLITDGVWQNLDCLYITAANSGLNSLPNWINPGVHDLTVVNLVIGLFTADRGWTGNGVNGYLRTNYNPSVHAINLSKNSASLGFYCRSNIAENTYDMGCEDAVPVRFFITSKFAGNIRFSLNDASSQIVVNADSRGFYIGSRESDTIKRSYRNKVRTQDLVKASIAIPNGEIYLMAQNISGVAFFHTTRQIAAAFIGGGTTQTNVDNFTDRIETYMDAIEAGVIP